MSDMFAWDLLEPKYKEILLKLYASEADKEREKGSNNSRTKL